MKSNDFNIGQANLEKEVNVDESQYHSVEINYKDFKRCHNDESEEGFTYKYDENLVNHDISYEDLALFVGEKSEEFYLKKWTKMENGNKAISWNWYGFVFNYYWFLYRKMYGAGFIFFLITVILNLVDTYFNVSLNLIFITITGAFANFIYKNYAIKKINKIKSRVMDYEEQRQVLINKGGINWIITILLITINFLLIFLDIINFATISLQFNF